LPKLKLFLEAGRRRDLVLYDLRSNTRKQLFGFKPVHPGVGLLSVESLREVLQQNGLQIVE
jgi:hypothetical protein